MEEEIQEGQVSRRRMLKRIGAGAAVAWTAPVLTSLRTPAFAQGSPPGLCPGGEDCRDPEHDCNAQIDCSQARDGSCGCGRTPENSCFCYQHGACGLPCTTQGDCLPIPGTACVASCCGFTCLPPCITSGRRSVPRGQRATFRR